MKNSLAPRFRQILFAAAALLSGVAPAMANPTIITSTETATPGEAVTVQGDSFGSAPQVLFHRVLSTDTTLTPDATPLTQLSSYLDAVKGNAINVQLPKNMPLGLYAIWVKDGTLLSAPKFINRARATGFEYAEVQSGRTFRIFGRNLSFPGQTPIVTFTSGGVTSAPVTVVTTSYLNDPNIIQIVAPTLTAGTDYTVNVSNNLGHNSLGNDFTVCAQTIKGYASGPNPFGIDVPWAQDPQFSTMWANTLDVTHAPYLADKTGATNSINAIQQAIYDAGNAAGGGTVYLPAGTYLINHTGEATSFTKPGGTITQPLFVELVIPSNVVIMGDGPTTIINDATTPMPYPDRAMVISTTSPSHLGLMKFTYQQSGTVSGGAPPLIVLGGSYCFYSDLTLNFAHSAPPNAVGGEFQAGNSTSHDVVVERVNLDYGGFNTATGTGNLESNVIIRNNVFKHHGNAKRTRMLVGGTVNLLFENNQCERDARWPGDHANDRAYEQGQVECDNALYHTYLTNTFYADNAPLDANSNSGETIGSQGQAAGVDDTGHVTAVGTNSVTDSSRAWPAGVLVGQSVTLAGTAIPETRTISGNTATTITLSAAWDSPYPISTYGYKVYDTSGTLVYSGNLLSATATTITISSTGTTFAAGLVGTVVVTPPGTQTQTITANTATSVTVGSPWNPTPTTSSTYDVTHGGYDIGQVQGTSGVSNTTVTCHTANPVGVNYWQTSMVGNIFAIISGKGMGQRRVIVANTTTTVTVDSAWDVVPDTTSRYAITGNTVDHLLIKGNVFIDQPRSISLYLGCHDCDVVNNVFKNTGQSIWLRATQLDKTTTGGWQGRMDLAWSNTVTDNSYIDTTGLYPGHFVVDGNAGGNVPYGSQVLTTDFRRNVMLSQVANPLRDAGSSLYEGYGALDYTHNYYSSIPVVLGSVFDDNESLNTAAGNTLYPIYLNSDSYVTTIRNQLNSGYFTLTPNPYAENYPSATIGSSGPSVATSLVRDPVFLQASFTGSGAGTGGASDGVDTGGAGSLSFGNSSGTHSFDILGTSPFTGTSGNYLECKIGPGTTVGHYMIQPTNDRTDWGRIFDYRTYDQDSTTGKWLVNGAFEFFWRPAADVALSNAMRPIDINNGANGLRFIFDNAGGGLVWQIATATGGGGVSLSSGAKTFTHNTIYHIAVTFATDVTTGVTTEKMYLHTNNGLIDTSSTTDLVATTTFTLNPAVTNNTSGFLSDGSWNFGDVYGNTNTNTNDYDGLKLYGQIPATFPGL